MAKLPYLPREDAELADWVDNFALKKEEHMAVFGFDVASVESTKKDAAAFGWAVNVLAAIRSDSKQFTAYKDILRDGPDSGAPEPLPTLSILTPPADLVRGDVFKRVSQDVTTIKNHANYTTSFGQDFDIIGAEDSFDPTTFKTILRLKNVPAGVEVKFVKKGLTGIMLYYRIQGSSEWIKVGLIVKRGYVHEAPLMEPGTPEVREYMARGVMDNDEVGPNSDIVEITVSP